MFWVSIMLTFLFFLISSHKASIRTPLLTFVCPFFSCFPVMLMFACIVNISLPLRVIQCLSDLLLSVHLSEWLIYVFFILLGCSVLSNFSWLFFVCCSLHLLRCLDVVNSCLPCGGQWFESTITQAVEMGSFYWGWGRRSWQDVVMMIISLSSVLSGQGKCGC